MKVSAEFAKTVVADCGPHPLHQIKKIIQIVVGVQIGGKDLAGPVQMPQVGPGIVPAHMTAALRVQGTTVLFVDFGLDIDPPLAGEEHTVTGIAGRHDTIEHIVAIDRKSVV